MRSVSCQDISCTNNGDGCGPCIYRSIISKKGYELIQAIEKCVASVEETNAVSLAVEFVELAQQQPTPRCILCGNDKCSMQAGVCAKWIPLK